MLSCGLGGAVEFAFWQWDWRAGGRSETWFEGILQETQVRSLDQEDPLEKGMATHSSILA